MHVVDADSRGRWPHWVECRVTGTQQCGCGIAAMACMQSSPGGSPEAASSRTFLLANAVGMTARCASTFTTLGHTPTCTIGAHDRRGWSPEIITAASEACSLARWCSPRTVRSLCMRRGNGARSVAACRVSWRWSVSCQPQPCCIHSRHPQGHH